MSGMRYSAKEGSRRTVCPVLQVLNLDTTSSITTRVFRMFPHILPR